MRFCFIVTCEHACNAVPKKFRNLFLGTNDRFQTHRWFDIGALHYASALSKMNSIPLFSYKWTRLLVDANRSLHNWGLFSEITRVLDKGMKRQILDRYYTPFRTKVYEHIQRKVSKGIRVVHLSCHTFTPVLYGKERAFDLGILYDYHNELERGVAYEIHRRLKEETSMRVRNNVPYSGISDGHVHELRKQFSNGMYVGIELEVNQALYGDEKKQLWKRVWLPRLIEVFRSGFEILVE